MTLWRPHPCGHFTVRRGCGGCDPGAGWTFDVDGRTVPALTVADVRCAFAPLAWHERVRLDLANRRLRWRLRWDEWRGWR